MTSAQVPFLLFPWLISQFSYGYYQNMMRFEMELDRHRMEMVERERSLAMAERANQAQVNLVNAKAGSVGKLPAGQGDVPLLEGSDNLDLLEVFTQPGRAYGVIGGQQTGKTYQARHIANEFISDGVKPVVVAPKWDGSEWDGCQKIGGHEDYDLVDQGLGLVLSEANARHSNRKLGHKDHPILPVFFDDWTAVVRELKSAVRLIYRATTLFVSVNVIPYFLVHADTAAAWGVDKVGAALKDNFTKLLITPYVSPTGMMIRSRATGEVSFPGVKDRRPVDLIHSRPLVVNGHLADPLAVGDPAPANEDDPIEKLVRIVLANFKAGKIKDKNNSPFTELFDNQGRKVRGMQAAACRSLGWEDHGTQNRRINEILSHIKRNGVS